MQIDPSDFNNAFKQVLQLKLKLAEVMNEKIDNVRVQNYERAAEARAQEVEVRKELQSIHDSLLDKDAELTMNKKNFHLKNSIRRLILETALDDFDYILRTKKETESRIEHLKDERHRLLSKGADDSVLAPLLLELVEQRDLLRMLKGMIKQSINMKKGL